MAEENYGKSRRAGALGRGRAGTPYFSETPLPRDPEFWARRAKLIDKRTSRTAGCWEWTGTKNQGGYGTCTFKANGRVTTRGAHRLQWERFKGPIPEGMRVRHRCDNPGCVRLDHLELGTAADNNADMMARGRHQTQKAGYAPRLQGIPTPAPEPPDILSEWQKAEWRKRYA